MPPKMRPKHYPVNQLNDAKLVMPPKPLVIHIEPWNPPRLELALLCLRFVLGAQRTTPPSLHRNNLFLIKLLARLDHRTWCSVDEPPLSINGPSRRLKFQNISRVLGVRG